MTIEKNTLIPSERSQLEAVYTDNPAANAIGIICHPHSLYGGTMSNKVITTVVKAWQSLGFSTVRFNFRGVGLSTGVFDDGRGEQEDLKAVIEWAQKTFGNKPIYLAGFSFGAYVALKFCQHFTPTNLLLIAPPQYHDSSKLQLPSTKCELIVAGEDEVVSTPATLEWAATQHFNEILNIPDASHFFHGNLGLIKEFVRKISYN